MNLPPISYILAVTTNLIKLIKVFHWVIIYLRFFKSISRDSRLKFKMFTLLRIFQKAFALHCPDEKQIFTYNMYSVLVHSQWRVKQAAVW